jgi:very-short-patch-repair endonuclease
MFAVRAFDPKHRVAALFARQYGLITRAQAMDAGMSAAAITRRLKTGEWIRVYENVFRLRSVPVTLRQLWLAACLRRPGRVWLSHRGAALFWSLDGFNRETVEVTADCDIRSTQKLIVHNVGSMDPADYALVESIPVTTVHRTLLDLGSVAPPDAVELALESALRRRITNLDRLYRRLEATGTQGRKGPAVLRRLLEVHSGRPTESALETCFVQFLRRARISMPDRQVVVRDESGFVARVDFIYERRKTIVEVDSRSHHIRRREWEADLRRRNRLTAEGYRVLHVTHERLMVDPGGLERELRQLLTA